MKALALGLAFVALMTAMRATAQTSHFGSVRCDPEAPTFSNIRVPQAVLADARPLAAGTYQVRITTQHPEPAVGQSATASCWVEFLKDGAIVAREIASAISSEEIGTVAKGPSPGVNQSRVDVLKGGEYVRVWINSAGTNYLINLAVAR